MGCVSAAARSIWRSPRLAGLVHPEKDTSVPGSINPELSAGLSVHAVARK